METAHQVPNFSFSLETFSLHQRSLTNSSLLVNENERMELEYLRKELGNSQKKKKQVSGF